MPEVHTHPCVHTPQCTHTHTMSTMVMLAVTMWGSRKGIRCPAIVTPGAGEQHIGRCPMSIVTSHKSVTFQSCIMSRQVLWGTLELRSAWFRMAAKFRQLAQAPERWMHKPLCKCRVHLMSCAISGSEDCWPASSLRLEVSWGSYPINFVCIFIFLL